MSGTATASETQNTATGASLMLAFELGEKGWKLGFTAGFGWGVLERDIASRDTRALLQQVTWAKRKLGLPPDAAVRSCYEAGRDGFWLHRFLADHGIENLVVDSSSIEVNRKQRRAKSDRLDVLETGGPVGASLGRQPEAGVERGAGALGRGGRCPPLDRELDLLKRDRTRVTNRIHGLLANVGLKVPRFALERQLKTLQLVDGRRLPPGLCGRLERYLDDRARIEARIQELEALRREWLRQDVLSPTLAKVKQLDTLRGIGTQSAWLLVMEFFGWRDFNNRREVGSAAGLTPTPYDSGTRQREPGIGKDGNRWVRGLMVELAWAWLRHQPNSELARWYQQRFAGGGARLRKIGIVGLARKLLIALWVWLETGQVPAGAELKSAVRSR